LRCRVCGASNADIRDFPVRGLANLASARTPQHTRGQAPI
jgi:hypothetical protein